MGQSRGSWCLTMWCWVLTPTLYSLCMIWHPAPSTMSGSLLTTLLDPLFISTCVQLSQLQVIVIIQSWQQEAACHQRPEAGVSGVWGSLSAWVSSSSVAAPTWSTSLYTESSPARHHLIIIITSSLSIISRVTMISITRCSSCNIMTRSWSTFSWHQLTLPSTMRYSTSIMKLWRN